MEEISAKMWKMFCTNNEATGIAVNLIKHGSGYVTKRAMYI
jgi:hypothetical protein